MNVEDVPLFTEKPSTCLYCDEPLPAKSAEHLFNSAWLGTEKSKWIICDACNNAFSHAVDVAFQAYTDLFSNARGIKRQRGNKDVPTIELGEGHHLSAYGQLKQAAKASVKMTDEETASISIEGTDLDECVEATIKALQEHTGKEVPAEKREEISQAIRSAEVTPQLARKVEFNFELHPANQYRSATHTLLKVLSAVDPAAARSALYAEAREFARYGTGDWTLFACGIETWLDPMAGEINRLDYLLSNAVLLWFDGVRGCVAGRLYVMGRVVRDVVLTRAYEGESKVFYFIEGEPEATKRQGGAKGRPYTTHGNVQRWMSTPQAMITSLSSAPSAKDMANEVKRFILLSSLESINAKWDADLTAYRGRFDVFDDDAAAAKRRMIAHLLSRLGRVCGQEDWTAEKVDQLLTDGSFDALVTWYAGVDIGDSELDREVAELMQRLMRTIRGVGDAESGM